MLIYQMEVTARLSFVALIPICAYIVLAEPGWAVRLACSQFSIPTLAASAGAAAALAGPVAAALVAATGATLMHHRCKERVDREMKLAEIKRRYCSPRFGQDAYRDSAGNPLTPREIADRHDAIANGILDCNICEPGCPPATTEGFIGWNELKPVKAANAGRKWAAGQVRATREGAKRRVRGLASLVGLI